VVVEWQLVGSARGLGASCSTRGSFGALEDLGEQM